MASWFYTYKYQDRPWALATSQKDLHRNTAPTALVLPTTTEWVERVGALAFLAA